MLSNQVKNQNSFNAPITPTNSGYSHFLNAFSLKCLSFLLLFGFLFFQNPLVAQVDCDWEKVSRESGTFSVIGSKNIRYGANGKFVYKRLSGKQSCTNAVFGDPIPGVVKNCYSCVGSSEESQLTFYNAGYYIARYRLVYRLNGKSKSFETGYVTLGQKRQYTIPAGATNISVVGEGKTGLIWKPWTVTFLETYRQLDRDRVCFKSYGTTLNQKWNTKCN